MSLDLDVLLCEHGKTRQSVKRITNLNMAVKLKNIVIVLQV